MSNKEGALRQFSPVQKEDSGKDILHEILDKLSSIETRLQALEETSIAAPKATLHSSREQFSLSGSDDSNGIKICSFEPGGKICDHCLMCTARGF
jgi:hypothetical protein